MMHFISQVFKFFNMLNKIKACHFTYCFSSFPVTSWYTSNLWLPVVSFDFQSSWNFILWYNFHSWKYNSLQWMLICLREQLVDISQSIIFVTFLFLAQSKEFLDIIFRMSVYLCLLLSWICDLLCFMVCTSFIYKTRVDVDYKYFLLKIKQNLF